MYHVKLTARAKKELKLLKKIHKKALEAAFIELKDDPFIGKPLKKELAGRYAYKVDVYRIIYTVNEKDKIVIVITAGHRSKIYQ